MNNNLGKKHLGYLPSDSPKRAIRRADSFLEDIPSICVSILCSTHANLK